MTDLPVLDVLARAPEGVPICLLLRHAERATSAVGVADHLVSITPEGVTRSRRLGHSIGTGLVTVRTSPLTRCTQTADAIREGAGIVLDVEHDTCLGAPGVFVVDEQLAGEQWARMGNSAMMDAMTSRAPPLAGLAIYSEAARRLLHHMCAVMLGRPGVHVFVTHDSILAGFVGQLIPAASTWRPRFLDGACAWSVSETVMLATATVQASVALF